MWLQGSLAMTIMEWSCTSEFVSTLLIISNLFCWEAALTRQVWGGLVGQHPPNCLPSSLVAKAVCRLLFALHPMLSHCGTGKRCTNNTSRSPDLFCHFLGNTVFWCAFSQTNVNVNWEKESPSCRFMAVMCKQPLSLCHWCCLVATLLFIGVKRQWHPGQVKTFHCLKPTTRYSSIPIPHPGEPAKSNSNQRTTTYAALM